MNPPEVYLPLDSGQPLNTEAIRHSIAQSSMIRLLLLQGNLEAGDESIGSFAETLNPSSFFVWLELPHVTHCRRLIATGSDDSLKEASERLDVLLEAAGTIHNTFHLIDILVLKALAFYKLSRMEEALKSWNKRWILRHPEGGFDLLSSRVTQFPICSPGSKSGMLLLTLSIKSLQPFPFLRGSPSPPPQPLIEPLTNREMDVLELLAKKLQSKEIAEKLSVSPETVRTHLGHIYQKLSVSGRRESVEKAKNLGII